MSINHIPKNIDLKLNQVDLQSSAFLQKSSEFLSLLQTQKLTTENIEEHHKNITNIYKNAMKEIDSIKTGICKLSEESQYTIICQTSIFEDKIERSFNRLNDVLLTIRPTAKIEYGSSCIGPIQLTQLPVGYACIRNIRGDGNCFLSSLTTRYLETLVKNKNIDSFIALISEDSKYPYEIRSEICTTLLEIQNYPSQLEKILSDNTKTLPIINYFRLLTADEMLKNKEDFEAFFRPDLESFFQDEIKNEYNGDITNRPYEELVNRFILQMGTDFSCTAITAICNRLKFCIKIIDPKYGAAAGLNFPNNQAPQATFRRNGQHYEVLYKQDEMMNQIAGQPITNISRPIIQSPPKIEPIYIHCIAPFGCTLFIRGSGSANLSWEKGIPLIEKNNNTWEFLPKTPLTDGTQCKFIMNDNQNFYEISSNREVKNGKMDTKAPEFNIPDSLDIPDVPVSPFKTTRIEIKSNAKPTICGNGPGMSWEKGIELQYADNGLWVFETELDFTNFEYKIRFNNDQNWEPYAGNRQIKNGEREEINFS